MSLRLPFDRSETATLAFAAALTAGFAWWSFGQAGYEVRYWGAGGVFLVMAVAVVVIGFGGLPRRPPTVELAGLSAFGGLVLWSFVSVIWADQPAQAWLGASRLLTYFALASLVAVLPWSLRSASVAIAGYIGVVFVCGIAALVVARQGSPDPFIGGRLAYPTGYQNANAALFLMAAWPCVVLISRRIVPVPLRALGAGAAVVLVAVALLSQSRASVIACVLTALALLAVVPGRIRTAAAIVLIAAPVVVLWDTLISVRDLAESGGPQLKEAADRAVVGVAVAALLVAALVTVWGIVDRRIELNPAIRTWLERAAITIAALAVIVASVVAVNVRLDKRIAAGWDEFTSVSGAGGFGGGLGTNRYDFWRVAVDQFLAHPALGIGADNFQVPYLEHRRSPEEPKYPHSVEFQFASQLGIVGIGLAAVVLVAGALAAAPRRSDPEGVIAVAGGVAGLALYWGAHASADWLVEIPGITAPTLVFVVIAAGVRSGPRPTLRSSSVVHGLGVAVGAAVLCCAVASPWLADREIRWALAHWDNAAVSTTTTRLDRARSIFPLGSQADTVAALIAVERGDVAGAGERFRRALDRDRDSWYLQMQVGLSAAWAGDRNAALSHLRVARALNPLEPLLPALERRVEHGETVSPADVRGPLADRRALRSQ